MESITHPSPALSCASMHRGCGGFCWANWLQLRRRLWGTATRRQGLAGCHRCFHRPRDPGCCIPVSQKRWGSKSRRSWAPRPLYWKAQGTHSSLPEGHCSVSPRPPAMTREDPCWAYGDTPCSECRRGPLRSWRLGDSHRPQSRQSQRCRLPRGSLECPGTCPDLFPKGSFCTWWLGYEEGAP